MVSPLAVMGYANLPPEERLALGMVVAVSLSFALFVWWLWRRLFRRAPRPQAG